MADKEDTPEAAPAKSNKLLIVAALAGVLLVGGGGAVAAYYMGAKSSAPPVAATEAGEPAPELPDEAVYVALEPAFTVNFSDQGKSRFLQLSVEAMTRDSEVAETIEQNMPMIRNNLVLLFSSKSSDQLQTLEGKQQLREETRAGIQDVISQEGADGNVEAVFFTSFVMQ